MADNYASVVASLDSSLPLSPYSELATAGLRAGFETVYDLPMSDIDTSVVGQVVQDVVSNVVASAMDSVSGVPIVGSILQFIGTVIDGVLEIERNQKVRAEIQQRQCQQMERYMKPVPTGFGGSIVPADLLSWYLAGGGVQGGSGIVTPPYVVPDQGISPTTGLPGTVPDIGRALWIYGYGYPVHPTRPPTLQTDVDLRDGSVTTYETRMADYEILRRYVGAYTPATGPTDLRREQFRKVANSIALTRNRRQSDGGVTVWPILLDILLDQAPSTPPVWAWFFATHSVTRPADAAPYVSGPSTVNLSDACSFPNSRGAVAQMIEGWRLTIDPIYVQDRARAAALRRQVDEEVRRMMRTLPASVQLRMRRAVREAIARPSLARRAAGVGILALGATAAVRPDVLLGLAGRARALLAR